MERRSRREELSRQQCKTWCESRADVSGAERWCCAYEEATAHAHASCSWTNGVATLADVPCADARHVDGLLCPAPLAFSPCAPAPGFALQPDSAPCAHERSREIDAVTLSECAARCLSDPRCQRFSFNPGAAGQAEGESGREAPRSCALHRGVGSSCSPALGSGWQTYRRLAGASSAAAAPLDVTAEGAEPLPLGCPAGSVTDALVMAGGAGGECAQLCLPPSLLPAAMAALRLERGECALRGCAAFAGSRQHGALAYNVFACAQPSTHAAPRARHARHVRRARGFSRTHVSCFAFSKSRRMPAPGDGTISEAECKAWCAANEPSEDEDEECCQYTVFQEGQAEECTWTNGRPALTAASSAALAPAARLDTGSRRAAVAHRSERMAAIALGEDRPHLGCFEVERSRGLPPAGTEGTMSEAECKAWCAANKPSEARQQCCAYTVYENGAVDGCAWTSDIPFPLTSQGAGSVAAVGALSWPTAGAR